MRLIKWLIGFIIFFVVLVALTPLAGRLYAVHWLKEQGYQAQIKSASFNLLSGKISIAGLDVRKSKDQGLRIDFLEAYIKLPHLLKKEFNVTRISTQGVRLDIGRLDAKLSELTSPLTDFVNRSMPAWRFDVINSLSEHTEVCRTGKTKLHKELSQCFSVGSFSLRDVTVQNTSRGWQLATRSTANFQRLYFKNDIDGTSLLYVGDVQVRDVTTDKSERKIGQIVVKSFHLVERTERETQRLDTPYQTQLDGLLINDIVESISPNQIRLQLGLVDVTALRQTLHKDSNAALVIISRLKEIFPSFSDVLAGDTQDGPEVIVEVFKTRVIDGAVAWLDDSVSPPANEALSGLSFELGAVSSSQPERRAPVTIVARLGESGDVFIRGLLAPFAEHPNFAVEGHIKGLDLSRISAYTETMLTEKVLRGRLDANFRAEALASNLQGDSAIRLTSIETGNAGYGSSVMSLQNSFNTLKDKNQSVDFDLYFNFDLLTIDSLAEALGRQAKRTLNNLATGQAPEKRTVAKKTSGMQFEPMKYNPNADVLMGTQELRLKDIVALAQEGQGKTLVLCPVTTGGEWAALYRQGKSLKSWEQVPSQEHQHLLDMSRLRAKVIAQDVVDMGLNRSRVELCEPTVKLDEDGPSFLSAELK